MVGKGKAYCMAEWNVVTPLTFSAATQASRAKKDQCLIDLSLLIFFCFVFMYLLIYLFSNTEQQIFYLMFQIILPLLPTKH